MADQAFSLTGTSTSDGMNISCSLTYHNPGNGGDVTITYTGAAQIDISTQIGEDVAKYAFNPDGFCEEVIAKGVVNIQTLRDLQRSLAGDQIQLGYIQQDMDSYNAKIADEQAQIAALQAQLNAVTWGS